MQKYHTKANNSNRYKFRKKKNDMHMAITNLNPYLWIRIYTGFDIKPNLRQTGIAKNLATFG